MVEYKVCKAPLVVRSAADEPITELRCRNVQVKMLSDEPSVVVPVDGRDER